jgi:hypothetical protein
MNVNKLITEIKDESGGNIDNFDYDNNSVVGVHPLFNIDPNDGLFKEINQFQTFNEGITSCSNFIP